MNVTFFNALHQFAVDRIPMATWFASAYLPRTGEYMQMHQSTWEVRSIVWTSDSEVEIYLGKTDFNF